MAENTDIKYIEAIDTGEVDWNILRGNFDNLADVVDEHADELKGLAQKQTQTISYAIDEAGLTTILNSNRHLRIKITNAFLQMGDSISKEDIVEIVGISNKIKVSNTEKAGKVRIFEVLKKQLLFTENIQVRTSSDRRVIVNVTFESTEFDN